MKSNFEKIGEHIRLIDERNTGLRVKQLLGLTISKQFIPSVANIIGTDLENYKIIRKNQFACSTMQVRRDKKMPVALLKNIDEAIISQAYPVFEVKDRNILLPEYLMMWFSRPEFDREACFYAIGGVRGSLEWEDFCDMKLPIPDIVKQKEIVREYNTIVNRIELNNRLIQKLEETAQAIYKQWFVDYEFPGDEGKPYKSNGGELVESELGVIPKGWEVGVFGNLIEITSGKIIDNKSDEKSKHFKYPMFGAGGIMGYCSDFLFNEKIISIGRVGTHGVVQRINYPCWASDNTLIIKSTFYEYSYQILLNLNYDEINRGGVQGLITQTDIKSTRVLIPNDAILKIFEQRSSKIFPLQEIKKNEVEILDELKVLLLSKLATIEN